MGYGQYKVSMTIGKALAADVRTETGVLYKGHIISHEDVTAFQIKGLETVYAVDVNDDDISLDNAQNVISNRLCGTNVTYAISKEGSVDILAMTDGLFVADSSRVEKFCSFSKEIKINIIRPYQYVKKGDIVAIIDFASPLYSKGYIDKIMFAIEGNADMLSVVSNIKKRVAVLYVKYYNDEDEDKYFAAMAAKMIEKTSGMEIDFIGEYFAKYNLDEIADQIQNASALGAEVVFVISSVTSIGLESPLCKAVSSVCDFVYGDGFSKALFLDILYGSNKRTKVLVLPNMYSSTVSDFVDETIYKVMVKEKISAEDISNKDCYIEPKLINNDAFKDYKKLASIEKISANKNEVAVVVLAAGTSRRTTKNKLLYEVDGDFLFMKSVKSAIEAKVGPVFVVTGYQSEEMVRALADYDVNIITNAGYKNGVKTSIKLGIDFVPSSCKGVVLLPADMPNVSAKHIRAMVKKFDYKKDKELVVSSYKGARSNPILWSQGLFSFADIWPEETSERQVFMAFEDVIKEVEVKDKQELLDVNYPADLEAIIKDKKLTKKLFGF